MSLTTPRRLQALAQLVVLAAVTLTGPACGPRRPSRPIEVDIFIDGSDRTKAHLQAELESAASVNDLLTPQDQLNIHVFGHGVQLVYRGPMLPTRRSLYAAILPKLGSDRDPLWKPGTLSAEVLAHVAPVDCHMPAISVVIGDGGVEDQSPAALNHLRAEVTGLAKDDQIVGLVLTGVAPEFREWWERMLAPLGTSRFAVRGFLDGQEAIQDAIDRAHGGLK